MKLSEFAAALDARVNNPGDDFEIGGITTLERAVAGDVSFVSHERFLPEARTSKASALIVPLKVTIEDRATIPMHEPWAGVLYLLRALYPDERFRLATGVHPTACVDSSAKLAPDAVVGPCAVVGPNAVIGSRTVIGPSCVVGRDCQIGEECLLHAAVVLSRNVKLGNRVILHPGAVIGADGFKYEVIGGKITKIPQVGMVIVEDDVEIGANTCVDRASFTETVVGAGTKIDNLVQIGHNVRIGANCLLVSQSGIAGSTEIGDGCILAAQVGLADNLKLGNRVTVGAQSGVKDHIKDGQTYLGTPAFPFRETARSYAAVHRLPDLVSEVTQLRQRVESLEKELAGRQK